MRQFAKALESIGEVVYELRPKTIEEISRDIGKMKADAEAWEEKRKADRRG